MTHRRPTRCPRTAMPWTGQRTLYFRGCPRSPPAPYLGAGLVDSLQLVVQDVPLGVHNTLVLLKTAHTHDSQTEE